MAERECEVEVRGKLGWGLVAELVCRLETGVGFNIVLILGENRNELRNNAYDKPELFYRRLLLKMMVVPNSFIESFSVQCIFCGIMEWLAF